MTQMRCIRSGIFISADDSVTILRAGSRAFAALTRMMPTADDTAYDYIGPDPKDTESGASFATTTSTPARFFPVCIGNGSVPITISARGGGGSSSRVTSEWCVCVCVCV